MSITVVGSVAYDTVTTGYGKSIRQLGGSAIHFSIAASKFTNVYPVGVYGDDFENSDIELLIDNSINISNLKKEKGKTFFWEGIYDNTDINNRETITTELNVFEKFVPELDDNAKKSDIIFLANINPQLQLDVLMQCKNINPDSFVGLDTMDLWINNSTELLNKVISRSNVVLVDQYEASALTGDNNLKNAGLKILESGAEFAVIKKGEHGALIFNKDYVISIPGYLTNYVKDPTGAGDSYAGAFFGYLDRIGNEYTFDNIFIASVLATVVASYTVQGFGSETLLNIGMNDIYERYEKYLNLIGQNSYMSLDNLKNKLDI